MVLMRMITWTVPHVVVVGRALELIVLVVVGFQSFMHVKGHPLKAPISFSNDSDK